MPKVFQLPDLGEGIHEGEIVEVLVKPGESILEGQPLLIVETDKASVEIPSPFTGVVEAVHVQPGQVVRVGDFLVTVLEKGEEAETAPVGVSAEGRSGGETPVQEPEARDKREGLPVAASPATRRLARELGVDLRQVRASGPGGRVTADDVRQAAQAIHEPKEVPLKPAEAAPSGEVKRPSRPVEGAPGSEPVGLGPEEEGERRVPLRSVRRVIARRMQESWARVPHVTHHEGIDITDLERLRQEVNSEAIDAAKHLSLTPFLVKAAVAVLKEFPFFNARLDEDRQEIVVHKAFHVGVAVDSPRGLVVPVLKNADRKSIAELNAELRLLSERARSGELNPEDVSGGTFTVTNIGPLGGRGFTPLINYPQVAILGAGRARLEPVVTGTLEDHTITVRLILPVVLAFDHRVVDGADGARFVNRLKALLENPKKMLIAL
ncbi:dihydrolipoamide acetyltransferase family protein [Desulfosoma caldarium]|uniref:Dihydrolipoamide acetyltransferase component of pyruvate dehydrogenase complex n=1 Tax=Desulfosoma caldarium TaxID=610254 RepID=A0A3N1VQH6_9BACT|nr:dihydrolipoamide acetyltransferase family protein [Desulfosoma caldarium]ROR03321.1 pyruvate dehydrogenase E2 component (dihydrolipoamide acetyltransferase) [Desulfosoma caldarium]